MGTGTVHVAGALRLDRLASSRLLRPNRLTRSETRNAACSKDLQVLTHLRRRVDRMEHNLQTLQSTVNNLVSLFSGGDRPALPSYPQQGVSLQSIASSSTSLNQHQHPMRLDASFNARSPLNPMSWDVTSTLNPLLPQPNYDYQQNSLQPPTIPAMNAIPRISNGSSMVGASPTNGYGGRESAKRPRHSPPGEHPPLPNYRAPPHPISQCASFSTSLDGFH